MTVAIVDYGSGNLRSAAKAFARAARLGDPLRSRASAARASGGARASEGAVEDAVLVTAEPERVAGADRVVLPGVGAFADCRAGLSALDGMDEALEEAVIRRGRPFLGICVGMQLMARVGREHGAHDGLGWIDGEVVPIEPGDAHLKVPHMGWNELQMARNDHPVFAGIADGVHAYFVHSYRFVCARAADLVATVDYGGSITAAIGRDNLVGTQFHPEKSQAAGLRVIANFLAWRP
ncbi:MAG: imidazole glycerol phosphate synthase subunit HisH [Kiloniellales bacterium]